MIYIYRILWLIFLIPSFIVEFLLFTISIPLFIIAGMAYFIKTGDVENTPDIFIPGYIAVKLYYTYQDLL